MRNYIQSTKSEFLKDHVTLKTGMMLEIQEYITNIKQLLFHGITVYLIKYLQPWIFFNLQL